MFPKSEIGLKKWLQCINCDKLRSLSFQKLRKQFVCRNHFEKRFLSTTRERVRLCPDAYPTLFTAREIASGIPQTDALIPDNSRSVNTDHDYLRKRRHVDHTYCKPEVVEKHSETDIVANELEADVISSLQPMPSTSGCVQEPIAEVLHCTPSSKRRRRIIHTKQKLSPHCSRLYKEYTKSRRQLNFNLRAKKALKFSKEKSFEKLTEKLNPMAKAFLWMQIKQCTKKARGRRFSDEEKLIAMAIMKQSPKCYRFLQRIFILPSKYTLNKMISKLNIEAGINSQIFEAVKKEVNTWDEKKKYCSILFDEVALEAALSYDKHKDIINGFVELNKKTNDFADHALVFMLRGVVHKWQQPLAFYFSVGNTGLKPLALVCDQGTAFQAALKSLQEDTRRLQIIAGENIDGVIVINGQKLSVIHDPPHLIKGLRNNFLTKNISLNGQLSKWNDIVDVYKTDCNHAQSRLLHKLTDEHVIPEKIKKMKVKNCTTVFSKTVAATLSYTAQFSHYADGTQNKLTQNHFTQVYHLRILSWFVHLSPLSYQPGLKLKAFKAQQGKKDFTHIHVRLQLGGS
ncbi:hypothetical protein PYW07_009637 [Mythimna separata]|uniref:THAP-type domain-containing protein n=1 Tax=Mythimna separata TaxID=271217 RepID=A0AAD8DNC6_MYTSE|nr:hypothetical protein PYW07_009637 [Mythimna separata]